MLAKQLIINNMTSASLRQAFLDFFRSKEHQIVPSAPMVVKNDPTLMFTNAGMNQFKDVFLGNSPSTAPRVADSQKCLRVSGKHNDLEEVGHDTYPHTMFEMLGNWSFGDYFKREAIDWAWEFLVDVLKIDRNRLYATVFEGSPSDGVELDTEAIECWRRHLPDERIIKGNKKDNFWEMGDTGPCGPCSEIHIDLRPDEQRRQTPGHQLVNKDHHLVIEIWNLVFMQYNRRANGSLEPLPAKHVDTGMGFERLAMVVQGKQSNYDTDIFTPLIGKIAEISGREYGRNRDVDTAMRVMADHVRTIAFAITDGQLPSNNKAGYVIRRILRRAVRYSYTFLGSRTATLHLLLPTLIATMGQAYPELAAQQELVAKVIKEEEEAFLRTLATGIAMLDRIVAETKSQQRSEVNGQVAFELYDTFGFPLDLTELILKEHGLTANRAEFEAAMAAQKQRARSASAVEAGDWVVLSDSDTMEFVGYDHTHANVRIARYRQVKVKNKELIQLVFNTTPFYAESGGQVGDTGYIEAPDGARTQILNTVKENNLTVHQAQALPADPTASFRAVVDTERRTLTANNHTATHLLHQALREVLGSHVEQKGSLVSPDGLRFDFSHFQKLTADELLQVERTVNRRIRQNIALHEMRSIPIDQARRMGAMALFGEKYGDQVRVIKFDGSVELCGGTHAPATGQIGLFKIMSESTIAAGVRRIEGITAVRAEELIQQLQDTLKELSGIFHNAPNLVNAVRKAIDENADLRKQLDSLIHEKTISLKKQLLQNAETIGNAKVISIETMMPADMVKTLAHMLRGEMPQGMAFVAGTTDAGKPLITIALSDDLVAIGLNASSIAREAAKEIQGGGGGQPFFAQAGGKDADGLSRAIASARAAISGKLQ